MAIASAAEQEPEPQQVIMGVVKLEESKLAELEKKMRRSEFFILQKKPLNLDDEAILEWFPAADLRAESDAAETDLTETADVTNSESVEPEPNLQEEGDRNDSKTSPNDNAAESFEEQRIFGYVLQRREATQMWNDFATEIGREICGICESANEQLHQYFPSVVTDQYLLQPSNAAEYLNLVIPTLRAGIHQLCEDKPTDPIQYLADWLDKSNS